MKILILGASRTVGTAMEEACLKRKIDFVSLSHDNLEITNFKESEITKYNCDVLINGVVMMGINPCETGPEKAFAINTAPISKLARACQKNNMIFIQPSTHAIFDGRELGYYTERSKPNPMSVYGVSKYSSEFLTKNLCVKHYITRFPSLFGKRRNNALGFTDKVYKWLKEGKTLKIATDKHDSLTYTKDVANRIIDMIEDSKPYGTYHITNEGKPSYYQFACKMRDLLGLDNKIEKVLDSDFPTLAPKPLNTKMSSIKLPSMRKWGEALEEFIKENG